MTAANNDTRSTEGMPLASGNAGVSPSAGGAEVTKVVTSGTFELDGGSWEVDNNVWVVGDGRECVIIDAAHEVQPILDAVAGRAVRAILLTHAHNDHVNVAGPLAQATGAPLYLHPDDRVLWELSQDGSPDESLSEGQEFTIGDVTLRVLHTPGHAPGACSFYAQALHAVFTGDTLFQGGPGATGRSFSDFPLIIESIKRSLLSLPAGTAVLTGHGESTTIGDEAPHLDEWIARGQ